MDRDLTIMIYGAIMGVVGSIVSSIVTAVFQLWLARREDERRHSVERSRELRHIHLPTHDEVMAINASRADDGPEGQRKAAEAGSIALSVFVGGVLVYQTNDPSLCFAFTAMLGYLATNRVIRRLRG